MDIADRSGMTQFKRRGVTLIEIMVVIAIIGVLTTLSIASYSQIGAASAPRNAINDLSAQLVRARNRAAESQADVWVIVYPTFHKQTLADPTANAATGGPGAYFLYEDKSMGFNRPTGGSSTEVYYQTGATGIDFDPVAKTISGTTSLEGKLIDEVYFDDYPGKNVTFGLPAATLALTAKQAPFNGVTLSSACTFCSGTPLRGAVVFSPDGSARFVDSAGLTVASAGATAQSRAHALTLKNSLNTRVYVVGISAPTAYIAAYDMK